MTDNVIELGVISSLPVPPERLLAKAADADLETVVIVGYRKSGDFYFSSTDSDAAQVAWLLDWAKKKLQDTCERMEHE